MRRRIARAIILQSIALSVLGGNSQAQMEKRPKLAVVIVGDQFRADHLSRFEGVYKHGFARLLREGAIFTDGHHDHAATVTAAGHATISSGVHPAQHGIVGNSWFDRVEKKRVYCAEDTTCALLGYAEEDVDEGRSPNRLLVSTIGDWLKAASPGSKVFSVARKDRAAILMAGKKADGAYWYNDDDGNFITSVYYATDYPDWVTTFNESRAVDHYYGAGWKKSMPEEVYFLAREDTFATERDGQNSVFPYSLETKSAKPDKEYYGRLQSTPFVDHLTIEFARQMVENEGLGADDVPDLLFIGCSAADAVGHTFGPLSQESMDLFLRLDGYLGDLFAFLDERIGQDDYVVALSSDHGVLPLPEELARRGFAAKRVPRLEIGAKIRKAFLDVAKELEITKELMVGLSGYSLLVDYSSAEDKGISRRKIDKMLADSLRNVDAIADVFTADELRGVKTNGREFQELFVNSFHPDRCGALTVRLKEYHLVGGLHGTSHGSPYSYDTHVPILFSGPGIKNASYGQRVRTVDVAPTLADILGIPIPDHVVGESLYSGIRIK